MSVLGEWLCDAIRRWEKCGKSMWKLKMVVVVEGLQSLTRSDMSLVRMG